MNTLSAGSTLIWFLADFEARACKLQRDDALAFLVACFKVCDLDIAELLRSAPQEVQKKGERFGRDAGELRIHVLQKGCDVRRPGADLRRVARKKGARKAGGSLHRSSEARAVFEQAAARAGSRGISFGQSIFMTL